jgi:hypothetical protein
MPIIAFAAPTHRATHPSLVSFHHPQSYPLFTPLLPCYTHVVPFFVFLLPMHTRPLSLPVL